MKAALAGAWHVHAEGYVRELLKDPRCGIAGVWDTDENRGMAVADKFSCPYYSDYDRMLLQSGCDGVIVCSPTSEHEQVIVKAAHAGKHIFSEKVLALSEASALRIADAVSRSSVRFVISYPHKCLPALQYAKQKVLSGELGGITYARVRNVHSGSINDWLPAHFYDAAQCGGGAMIDLGAHPMYTLLWLMGEPLKVSSVFANFTARPVEDNAVCVMSYANGAIGVSETGFVSPYGTYILELDGTKGALRVTDRQAEIRSAATSGQWQAVPELLPQLPSPLFQWISLVLDGIPADEFNMEQALQLTRVMDKAYAKKDGNI